MKQWKRIFALMMSVLTMGTTMLGAGCKGKETGEVSSSVSEHTHKWNSAVVTKEATCTENGIKTKTCKICGEEETEEIAASHRLVNYGSQTPTCTTIGWTSYEACENCSYTTYQEISLLGHNYVNDTCTRCGGDISDCTHTWGSYTTLRDSTCSEEGEKMRTCTSCYEEELAAIPAGHTLVQGQGRAALCLNSGWTGGLYCEKCDYDEREYLPAMGHNYVNGSCVNPGCNQGQSGGGNGQVDATKANLSVATFDGGVGKAWLEDAIDRFEELYATATHFEEGKVGVKISLDGDKNKYGGNKLLESVMNKDVYFTEAVDYYGFVNQGTVADLTDVVTGSMAAYGEMGTIEDKLDPTAKAFMTAKDGKYYMIPFYDGYYGFIYDVELFEEQGFYFDEDGDFTSDKTKFANGPDGKAGTYDDGLPATYDQMIQLCDRIVQKGYTPFMYSGNYPAYVNRAFVSYVADYEGYDAFSLNKTFNGKAKLVKSVAPGVDTMEATIEFEEVDISEANGYELQRQAGKYYALAMEEALFGTSKYINRFNGLDYTVAQSEFIKGKYGADTMKRYAMLAEGVWWENESASTFAELENIFQEGKMDRKFGFMPIPKVNEAAAGDQTMFSQNSSFGFINKECKNMELAKEFMKFLHTDLEMSKFTAKTSIPRSLDYEVMEHDRATASYFGQTLIDMRANAKVVYPYSATDLAIQNPANFENDTWFGLSMVGSYRNNAFNAFKNDQANALQYFQGLYTYQKGVWSSLKR